MLPTREEKHPHSSKQPRFFGKSSEATATCDYTKKPEEIIVPQPKPFDHSKVVLNGLVFTGNTSYIHIHNQKTNEDKLLFIAASLNPYSLYPMSDKYVLCLGGSSSGYAGILDVNTLAMAGPIDQYCTKIHAILQNEQNQFFIATYNDFYDEHRINIFDLQNLTRAQSIVVDANITELNWVNASTLSAKGKSKKYSQPQTYFWTFPVLEVAKQNISQERGDVESDKLVARPHWKP